MTLDECGQQLAELANCGDPHFANAANYVSQIVRETQSGQMAREELVEILEDVQRQLNIIQDMNRLEFKEKMNTAINGLITIAKLV